MGGSCRGRISTKANLGHACCMSCPFTPISHCQHTCPTRGPLNVTTPLSATTSCKHDINKKTALEHNLRRNKFISTTATTICFMLYSYLVNSIMMVDVSCSCPQPYGVSIHLPFLKAPWISFPEISAMRYGWFTSHSTTRINQVKKLNPIRVNGNMFLELLENTCSLNLSLTLEEGFWTPTCGIAGGSIWSLWAKPTPGKAEYRWVFAHTVSCSILTNQSTSTASLSFLLQSL